MPITTTLTWHPPAESMPERDTTVLVYLEETEDVGEAYHDGDGWRWRDHDDEYGEGAPIEVPVTLWTEMPFPR